MMEFGDMGDGKLIGGAVAAMGSAVWGILWLRKTFSSDNRAIGQDHAERDTMKFLVAERDNYATLYRDAVASAQKAEVLNERLLGKVETLTEANTKLTLQVSNFDLQLKSMRKLLLSIAPERAGEIFNSDFSNLDGGK